MSKQDDGEGSGRVQPSAAGKGRVLPSLGVNGVRSSALPAGAVPARFRIVLVSFLSAGIGLVAGGVAFLLYRLIGLFTNLFFFHRWETAITRARLRHLGL